MSNSIIIGGATGATGAGAQYAGGSSLNTHKVVTSTGTVSPLVYKSVAPVVGSIYRLEVICKAAEYNYINLYGNGSLAVSVTANLTDGTVENVIGTGGAITPLANGWYLVSATVTATATTTTNMQTRIMNSSKQTTYTGDGVSGIYIDSIKLFKNGVSQWTISDAADAYFTKAGCTIASVDVLNNKDTIDIKAVATIASDLAYQLSGALTADRLTEGTGTISPSCYRNISAIAGRTYELTVWAKQGERNLNLYSNAGFIFDVTFDLRAGTVSGTAGVTKTITRIKNGQYICKVSGVASASASTNIQLRLKNGSLTTYTGDGVSGLWLHDAKLTKDGIDTNLFTNSALFATSAWTKAGLTVIADNAMFGGLDLDKPVDFGLSAWVGKKLTCLGTSITAQGYYTTPLQAITGVVLTNAGTAGGSIAVGAHYGSLYIYNAIATIPTDSEVVTVEPGINDFGTDNSDIGTLGDTTTATFYGAIFAAVGAIRARAPNAKIIFLTPFSGAAAHATHRIRRVNSKGHTLQQFQNAVYESAGYCGYHCIDVGRMAGIGYFTPEYMGDNLHLNAAGGQRYAAYVAEQFARLARAGYL